MRGDHADAPELPFVPGGALDRIPRLSGTLSARWFQALYDTPLLFSGILDEQGWVLDANRAAIEG